MPSLIPMPFNNTLIHRISELLKDEGLDLATFHHLPEHFDTIWRSLEQANLTVGARNPEWTVHRALILENKRGFLLERMRSKHRTWVRKKEQELSEAFGDDIRWVWHSKFDSVDSICQKMELVAATTYQRGLGVGFLSNYETKKRLELFARRGELRVLILEAKGEPVRFWYGVLYKSVFHAAATGYKPNVEKFEVGTQSLFKTVDALVEEGAKKFDFGLGEAHYKQRFGDVS